MDNYGYIYMTTNLINNHKYIGQHRATQFEPNKYIGSGSIITKAINKYGKQNFQCELLEWCGSKDSLNEREKYWIDYYDAMNDPNFYNLQTGGEGGYKRSEIIKNHLSNIAKSKGQWKGKNNPHYGVHKNFGTGMTGKRHTQESKLKMSNSRNGLLKGHPYWGRPLTLEEKLNLSQKMKSKGKEFFLKIAKNRIGTKYNHSESFYEKQRIKQQLIEEIKKNNLNKRKSKSKTHLIDKDTFIQLYTIDKVSYKDILKFCKINYGVGSWTVDKFIKENHLERKLKGVVSNER